MLSVACCVCGFVLVFLFWLVWVSLVCLSCFVCSLLVLFWSVCLPVVLCLFVFFWFVFFWFVFRFARVSCFCFCACVCLCLRLAWCRVVLCHVDGSSNQSTSIPVRQLSRVSERGELLGWHPALGQGEAKGTHQDLGRGGILPPHPRGPGLMIVLWCGGTISPELMARTRPEIHKRGLPKGDKRRQKPMSSAQMPYLQLSPHCFHVHTLFSRFSVSRV